MIDLKSPKVALKSPKIDLKSPNIYFIHLTFTSSSKSYLKLRKNLPQMTPNWP